MMAAIPASTATSAPSVFPTRTRWPLWPPVPVPVAPIRPSSSFSSSVSVTTSLCFRCSHLARQSHHITARKASCWNGRRAVFAVKASATGDAAQPAEKWLLEPVGDGDYRHIGYRVPMPGGFEMASDVVTVGRLSDKADMVIPIATVSRVHARLEKKEGVLLVTDLDSTNGTFVDDTKVKPGAVAAVQSGSCLTFGDTHLAMFRVSKLDQDENLPGAPADSEIKTETEVPPPESAT